MGIDERQRSAPSGQLLTGNGDATNDDVLHVSEIVEFSSTGSSSGAQRRRQPGPRVGPRHDAHGPFDYAAIDDVKNNLSVYRLPTEE